MEVEVPVYQPTGRRVQLVLDQQALDSYTKEYFRVYPRRRKVPIKEPIVPSLNKYQVLNKDARNELKERWEEFVYHTAEEAGLLHTGFEHCILEVHVFFGDKRRSDLDNRILKCPMDGIVRAGLIKDDNRFVLPQITHYAHYRKGEPGMIFELIEIEPF